MTWAEIKEKLKGKKIGIAGCGGLGSNATVALARIGVKSFVLADFDVIEASNLNRQYFFKRQVGEKKVNALRDILLDIDDTLMIETHDIKLKATDITSLFAACDLIIEAFDKAESKQMIVETVIENFPEKPLILGIGLAGIGGFDKLREEKWSDNIYVCGDSVTESSDDFPPLAPRVCIVANMQANLAIELLLR